MKKFFNLEEENQIISNLTTKNISIVNNIFNDLNPQLNFFIYFFQISFKTSQILLENQKKNILFQQDDNHKELENEAILNNLNLINKEINDQYRNLTNKYYEIIVRPFNIFTTGHFG